MSPVNTAYLGSGQTANYGPSGASIGLSLASSFDNQSGRTQAGFFSFRTTASATSAILPDGAFGVYFHSGNSCRLCFRSGATTYTFIATTGGVL